MPLLLLRHITPSSWLLHSDNRRPGLRRASEQHCSLATLVILATACSSPAPAVVPGTVVPRPVPISFPERSAEHSATGYATPASGVWRYKLTYTGAIKELGQSIQRSDSILQSAILSLHVAGSTWPARITATIDSVTDLHSMRPGPVLPPAMSIELGFGTTSQRQFVNSSQCDRSEFYPRNLWFLPPDSLELPHQWTDTTSTKQCRGGITLHTVTITHYVVTDTVRRDSTGIMLRIQHNESSTVHGDGYQSEQLVKIEGTGKGSGETLIHLPAWYPLSARKESDLQLTFTSSFRTQQFHQRLKQDAVLDRQ